MGCDIHVVAEFRIDGKWKVVDKPIFAGDAYDIKMGEPLIVEPFGWRSYAMFAFFAGVRNDGTVIPLAEPRGLPDDACDDTRYDLADDYGDLHSTSWLSLRELIDADFGRHFPTEFWKHEGIPLGDLYFEHLETLKTLGKPDDVRIVFAFDN